MCIGHVNLIPPRTMNGVVPAREGDATLLNGPKAHGNELFGKKRDTHTHTHTESTLKEWPSLFHSSLCVLSPRVGRWLGVSRRLVCAPGNAAEPDNYVD
jgi:hypothetical protein